MVGLDVARAHTASIFRSRPIVAVFAGATAGLGESTLRALAAAHGDQGKGLRVYVVGRKKASFDKVAADCRRVCPRGQFLFVQANDLALLADVDKACAEITKTEQENAKEGEPARVDLMCLSQGDFTFTERKDTKEGIEFRMSLLYYSRMKFVVNLLPLLRASEFPAHVISVFAGGGEADLDLEDISLRDPKHYGMAAMRSHVVWLHDFFLEYLAAQNAGKISLVHVFPGLVKTPAFKNPGVPVWFRALWTVLTPVVKLLTTPLSEAGERILFLASPSRFPAKGAIQGVSGAGSDLPVAKGTDGDAGSGAYAVKIDGETAQVHKSYAKYKSEGVGEKLVAHTLRAFDEIKAGKTFTG